MYNETRKFTIILKFYTVRECIESKCSAYGTSQIGMLVFFLWAQAIVHLFQPSPLSKFIQQPICNTCQFTWTHSQRIQKHCRFVRSPNSYIAIRSKLELRVGSNMSIGSLSIHPQFTVKGYNILYISPDFIFIFFLLIFVLLSWAVNDYFWLCSGWD